MFVAEGLGAAISPAALPDAVGTDVVDVVVVGADWEEVDDAGFAVPGGLTANCEPVTTVTWDPATTFEGSNPMTTAPDMERATDSAAASAAAAWVA